MNSALTGKKKQFIEIFRIILFAGAALWIFGGLPKTLDVYHYFGADKWMQIDAKIIKSEVIKTSGTSSSSIRNCDIPVIEFEYQYNNKVYTSNKWGFSFFDCSSSSWAYSVTKRFRQGSKTVAYVNPESNLAVLDPDISPLWLVLIMGVGCISMIWLICPKST